MLVAPLKIEAMTFLKTGLLDLSQLLVGGLERRARKSSMIVMQRNLHDGVQI
jgi:hypothetical protein